jgi:hypothetical protein
MKNNSLEDVATIHKKIIEFASKSTLICYSDLVPDVLCDNRRMNRLSKVLTQISKLEWEDKKLLLSSIVVLKGTRTPSSGYFELCNQLNASTNYEEMQQKCFEYWKNKKGNEEY